MRREPAEASYHVHRQVDAAVKNLGPDATPGQVKDIAMAAIKKMKPNAKGRWMT